VFLEPAQKGNSSHISAVKTEGESPSNRNDSHQPIIPGGEIKWKRKCYAGRSGQNAHEMHNVGAERFTVKRLRRDQSQDVISRADRDLSFER
jgi:hypothetical protein